MKLPKLTGAVAALIVLLSPIAVTAGEQIRYKFEKPGMVSFEWDFGILPEDYDLFLMHIPQGRSPTKYRAEMTFEKEVYSGTRYEPVAEETLAELKAMGYPVETFGLNQPTGRMDCGGFALSRLFGRPHSISADGALEVLKKIGKKLKTAPEKGDIAVWVKTENGKRIIMHVAVVTRLSTDPFPVWVTSKDNKERILTGAVNAFPDSKNYGAVEYWHVDWDTVKVTRVSQFKNVLPVQPATKLEKAVKAVADESAETMALSHYMPVTINGGPAGFMEVRWEHTYAPLGQRKPVTVARYTINVAEYTGGKAGEDLEASLTALTESHKKRFPRATIDWVTLEKRKYLVGGPHLAQGIQYREYWRHGNHLVTMIIEIDENRLLSDEVLKEHGFPMVLRNAAQLRGLLNKQLLANLGAP